MMEQPSLFNETFEKDARTTDPQTSRAAAHSPKLHVRWGTYTSRLLAQYYSRGKLTDEQAGRLALLEHAGYWKRCADLRRLKLIRDTGETRVGDTGQSQMLCEITGLGIELHIKSIPR